MKDRIGDKAALKWLLSVIKGTKRYVVGLTVLQVILGASSMGYALFLSGLVDRAVLADWAGFWRYVLLLISLALGQCLLRCIVYHLEEASRASIENILKRRLFSQLLSRDYAAVTAIHSGEWMNRLTSDVRIVAEGVATIVPGLAGTLVKMVSAVALLIVYAPVFGWAFVGCGLLVIGMTWGFRKLMKKLHVRVQTADGQVRVHLSERLGSMMILRAFGKEQAAVDQAGELMQEHKNARMKRNSVSSIFYNGFGLAMNCVYVAGAMFCGYGILTGAMSYGTFTAVLQLVGQTNAPIANISAYFPRYTSTMASAERLKEAEDFAQEPTGPVAEDIPGFYRAGFESLRLKKACFTYQEVGQTDPAREGRATVLKDLDMEIRKGQYVAFCGPSGCGKSTVLKLLMCMYNLDSGECAVVGRGGDYPLTASWRGLFAYVPQGNQLMCGTIREVVTFGEKEAMAQDTQIRRALQIACADQFISQLPEGLDTQLGERGAGLSEGQMQRIAIARAIFSDRPILLLDEATSALDEQTEAQLLSNLRSMTDKTVIIVTHRPAALEITDQIIRFEPHE